MKKFTLLSCVFVMMAMSCAKTDNATLSPNISTVDKTLDYQTMVIGTWQLAEIGTPTSSTDNNNSGSTNGCGSGEGHNELYLWTNAYDNEKLTFNADGGFVQDKVSDAPCRGAYQLKGNAIVIKADCAQDEPNMTITSMNKSQMIVEKIANERTQLYKYQHL